MKRVIVMALLCLAFISIYCCSNNNSEKDKNLEKGFWSVLNSPQKSYIGNKEYYFALESAPIVASEGIALFELEKYDIRFSLLYDTRLKKRDLLIKHGDNLHFSMNVFWYIDVYDRNRFLGRIEFTIHDSGHFSRNSYCYLAKSESPNVLTEALRNTKSDFLILKFYEKYSSEPEKESYIFELPVENFRKAFEQYEKIEKEYLKSR